MVILVILLIGQLIYFNFSKKKGNSDFKQNWNMINNAEDNSIQEVEERYTATINEIPITEVVEPNNIDKLSQTYKGDVKLVTLEKELYKFITQNVREIYNGTSGKSINQVLQLYDLKKEVINNMNIYSAEDFKGIVTEVLKVGGVQGIKYSSSSIDMESYNNDENGYSTFNITFTYTNMSQIKIKVYLANNSSTLPNIKLGN